MQTDRATRVSTLDWLLAEDVQSMERETYNGENFEVIMIARYYRLSIKMRYLIQNMVSNFDLTYYDIYGCNWHVLTRIQNGMKVQCISSQMNNYRTSIQSIKII